MGDSLLLHWNCSANKNDILFQKKQKASVRAALSIRGLFVQALIKDSESTVTRQVSATPRSIYGIK
jgi:hypothetical protein